MSVAPRSLDAWSYLQRYRKVIARGLVMLLATNVFGLGGPYLVGRAIDALRSNQHAIVWKLCAAMVGFALLTAVTRVASRVWIFHAARSAEYDVRADLFAQFLRLDAGYHRAHPTGESMSRMTSDIATVRAMWGAGVLNLTNTLFAFGSVLIMMARIDWRLTLWGILPYPIIYVIGQSMSKHMYRGSQNVQAAVGALSARLQEDLGGIAVIKAYTLEPFRRAQIEAGSQTVLTNNMALAKTRLKMEPNLRAMASAGVIIALWRGGAAVADHRITVGQLFEFLGYLARLVWPTLALGWMISLLQRGKGAWSRLASVLATAPQIVDGAGPPLPPDASPPAVRMEHLTVAVDGRTLLRDICVDLPPGSVTAVVGPTGGGKSTFVDALLRLVDVPAGTVFVRDRDITTLPLDSLRSTIGYAPQDAFLFSMSIADNIGMGIRDAANSAGQPIQPTAATGGAGTAPTHWPTRRANLHPTNPPPLPDGPFAPAIEAAANQAGLTRDLASMPHGLATIVGERGITLSGGQRQRVALARALAPSPPMLVLDDSLSSVDAQTERIILRHLREVGAGRTVVLISHRVAAVKDADQILVMAEGTIVERGTHAALLAANGTYATLYKSQLDLDLVAARTATDNPTPEQVGATP